MGTKADARVLLPDRRGHIVTVRVSIRPGPRFDEHLSVELYQSIRSAGLRMAAAHLATAVSATGWRSFETLLRGHDPVFAR